jgi:Ca2+-transporting ATPase
MARFGGFNGDYTGLTKNQVEDAELKYGKNEIVPEKKENLLHKILEIFKEPMFILLFVTATIYFLLGQFRDGIIMVVLVAMMAVVEIIQEWRTDKTLQALKDLSSPKVNVIRDDECISINSSELVPGDLVILEEGEKVPSDGQVVEMRDLGADESSLTGESEIVWKQITNENIDKDVHWRKDYCYAGTMITQGSGIIRITAIGGNTEYGKIGLDVAAAPDRPTPLEKQTRQLIKVAATIGISLFILVTVITFANEYYDHGRLLVGLQNGILSGITLAMGIIPEEFPVILTVFLSMGAWRLARKNTLIRRLPSVETLGAVTVLCVDKTGTLTKNQMEVKETFVANNYSEKELAFWSSLGCETEPYDPMEKAILLHSDSFEIERTELFSNELILEYPFSSETRMMGHVWRIKDENCLAAKGSPESILPLCNLSADELLLIEKRQTEIALKGLRVIAVACSVNMGKISEQLTDNRLAFIGLLGLADPPRDAVSDSVKLCTCAGIRVVMITGDNGLTACSIASQIGIPNSDNILTGNELETLSEEELCERVKTTNIFARVIPRHKMRIVMALKKNKEVVAMTGDGVNDAPALKYADIGIAMGMRGTGVAKEAADMILLDDNFTTIVDTVKDGRRIYDNIRKAIGYVFVIHIPIAFIALLAPIMRINPMLLPIHIVLLELIIDPTCSIVFERQPSEKDIMERKPRPVTQPLVTSNMLLKSILQGLSILIGSFGSYFYLLEVLNQNVLFARSFALAVLLISNILLVYVNQSERSSIIKSFLELSKDMVMWLTNIGVILILTFILYTPWGNSLAQTVPLSPINIISALGIAVVATVWWEIVKLFKRLIKK